MVTRVGTDENDTIEGGSGDDRLEGRGGLDELTGGGGADTLLGGGLSDIIVFQHGGADSVDGGDGDDQILMSDLDSAKGVAKIDGGQGADEFAVRSNGDAAISITLSGTPSKAATLSVGDEIRARLTSIEDTFIYTGAGNDRVTAGSGRQIVDLGEGRNRASLGGGDDYVALFLDGERDDIAMGGGSFDRLFYYERGDTPGGLVMSRDGDTLSFRFAGVESARVTGVEDLDIRTAAGGSGGVKSNDVLLGATGDDVFVAGGASDRIDAGAGADDVQLLYDGALDIVSGGDGRDRLFISPTNNASAVVMKLAGDTVTVVQAGKTVVQASDFESVDARGGLGNDVLIGLEGDDDFYGYRGADTINGGAGEDTAHFTNDVAGVSVTLIAGQSVRAFVGGAASDLLTGIENLEGTAFADTLIGDGGDNVIDGGANSSFRPVVDFLDGRGGVDTYLAGFGSSIDRIDLANDSNIRNFENAIGNTPDEALIGNAKANRLESGGGFDTMTGGDGADTFAFTEMLSIHVEQNPPSEAQAAIRDFSTREGDRIDLRELFPIDFNEAVELTFVGRKAFSGDGPEVRVTESKGNSVVRVDYDGDGIDDFLIALKDATGLGRDDFIL